MIKKVKKKEYWKSREKTCLNPKTIWKFGRTALYKSALLQIWIPSLNKPDKGLKNDLKRKIKMLE